PRLLEREGAAPRTHPHDQTVAARHRPQPAGAPALDLEGCGDVHAPAFLIARSSSSEAELRRVTHRPRSRASRSRADRAAVAAGFLSSIAASTASSAIKAACAASNK